MRNIGRYVWSWQRPKSNDVGLELFSVNVETSQNLAEVQYV